MKKLIILAPALLLCVGVAAVSPMPLALAKDAPVKNFDAKLDAPLMAAIGADNASEVRNLLARGANPNAHATDSTGATALGSAAAKNTEIVKLLVAAGADLEKGNALGQTVLLLMALNDRTDNIIYLVQSGAKIENGQYQGLTPLMIAATAGKTDSVRRLLRLGANVNARDNNNATALIYGSAKTIAGQGNLEVVKILVEAGADLFVVSKNGLDALAMAKKHNLNDIASYLATKTNLDIELYNAGLNSAKTNGKPQDDWQIARDLLDKGAKGYFTGSGDSGYTALIWFSSDTKNFDETTAKRLIAVSDLNVQNKNGQTALHVAAAFGNEKMVALLIAAGANLSTVDKSGKTPLGDAQKFPAIATMLRNAGAKNGTNAASLDEDLYNALVVVFQSLNADKTISESSWAPVEKLLNAGASGRFTFEGVTALIVLAQIDEGVPLKDEMIQTLIARSDINAQDEKGNTALLLAADYDNRKIVELLIAAGADLSLRNKDGETAREVAEFAGDATLETFDKAVANRPATNAPAKPNVTAPVAQADKDKALFELVTKIFVADFTGETVPSGDWANVASLLNAGATGHYVSAGKTALLRLAGFKKVPLRDEVLATLIARSDVNAQDEDGNTALMQAVLYNNRQIFDLLMAAGADVNLRDSGGLSAGDIADKMKNPTLKDILDKAAANPAKTVAPPTAATPPAVANGNANAPAKTPVAKTPVAATRARRAMFAANRAFAPDESSRAIANRAFNPTIGVDEVRLGWGVQDDWDFSKPLPTKSVTNVRMPNDWMHERELTNREIRQNPDDIVARLSRVSTEPFIVPVIMSPEDAEKFVFGTSGEQAKFLWYQFEELLKKGPVPARTIMPVVKGLGVDKYAPNADDLRRGDSAEAKRISERVSHLKTALKPFESVEEVSSLAKTVERLLDGKVALAEFYAAPTDGKKRFNAQTYAAGASRFAAQTPNAELVSLLAVAASVALGDVTPAQLPARAAAFKTAHYADDCASVSLFLNAIGEKAAAKTWAQLAVSAGGDSPTVWLAHARTLPANSRERFEALQKSAMPMNWLDRDKAGALNDWVASADTFGTVEQRRLAREELLMSRGTPRDWADYAEFELQSGEWANAYNANRLIVLWQPLKPVPMTAEQRGNDKVDPIKSAAVGLSPRIDARLKGAFLMLKLGYIKASNAEYRQAIFEAFPIDGDEDERDLGATIDRDYAATFTLHRRLLRAQLAKTPGDANLKAALDRLIALEVDGGEPEDFVITPGPVV